MGSIPIFVVIILYSIILHRAVQNIIQSKKEHQIGSTEVGLPSNLRNSTGRQQRLSLVDNGKRSEVFKISKPPASRTNTTLNKWKTVNVVIFITGSFVITWMPYLTSCVVYIIKCESISIEKQCTSLRELIAGPLAILGFMNSLLNPLIYAWWHNGFRNYFKRRWQIIMMKRKINMARCSQRKKTVSLIPENLHTSSEEITISTDVETL